MATARSMSWTERSRHWEKTRERSDGQFEQSSESYLQPGDWGFVLGRGWGWRLVNGSLKYAYSSGSEVDNLQDEVCHRASNNRGYFPSPAFLPIHTGGLKISTIEVAQSIWEASTGTAEFLSLSSVTNMQN